MDGGDCARADVVALPPRPQIYDYIDRHITKLDKDCKAFDAEIAKERHRLGMPPAEPTIGGAGGGLDLGKRKRKDGEQRKLTAEEQYQVGTHEQLARNGTTSS
jgi:hypothetical protein